MRTRVKICGITRPEDGRAAARLGADALGLVFYAPSPRYVTPQQAQLIAAALPPFVSVVGLFVNAPLAQIRETLACVPLDLLQFHGDETPEECARYGKPYIKALRVKPEVDVSAAMRVYASACGLLLDAYADGVPGGTGQVFDWSVVPRAVQRPIILAGGLRAENVAQAIRQVRPYAVDVSGGVESAPGVKDETKMAAFVSAVNAAD